MQTAFPKLIAALVMVPLFAFSQVKTFRQQQFRKSVPAGNYSGITSLGNDRYAVVSDKSASDGFYIFRMPVDTVKGCILEAECEGFFSSGQKNRDMEDIAYRPSSRTIFICGESDNEIYEYSLDGKRTGRRLQMPLEFAKVASNLGLESLTYDTFSCRFFTTTERPLPNDSLLRIQSFGDDLLPRQQYLYRPDAPLSRKYYWGVSALCALGDGRLLVLERQLRIPRLKIGAKAVVRLYVVDTGMASAGQTDSLPMLLKKTLLLEFTTSNHRFANYEGICMPYPHWLFLVADSQNRYKGVLRDWMRLVSF
jgi:hypothetical protein